MANDTQLAVAKSESSIRPEPSPANAGDNFAEGKITLAPDCALCWLRDSCPDAQPGAFCTMWTSREPAPKEPDPNDQWRRGEDVFF